MYFSFLPKSKTNLHGQRWSLYWHTERSWSTTSFKLKSDLRRLTLKTYEILIVLLESFLSGICFLITTIEKKSLDLTWSFFASLFPSLILFVPQLPHDRGLGGCLFHNDWRFHGLQTRLSFFSVHTSECEVQWGTYQTRRDDSWVGLGCIWSRASSPKVEMTTLNFKLWYLQCLPSILLDGGLPGPWSIMIT